MKLKNFEDLAREVLSVESIKKIERQVKIKAKLMKERDIVVELKNICETELSLRKLKDIFAEYENADRCKSIDRALRYCVDRREWLTEQLADRH
jgi:hypothetical protein